MMKFLYALVAAAVLSTSVYGKENPAGSKLNVRSKEYLNQLASELNKSFPMMVDSETEITNVMGFDSMLVYNYRLVNVEVAELDKDKFVSIMRSQLLNGVCTNPETQKIIREGVTLRYTYADKTSKHIASVDVRPADCKLE